jgi:transcriptional regulator with XRE-family HTH domain
MADPIRPDRLRDAREYLGLTVAEVAGALGCEPSELERIEAGGVTITGEQARKLSRLYRRPVAWLRGETTFTPGQDLLRQVEGLGEHDRSAVLEFAEFLQGAGPAPARAQLGGKAEER